jgi:hypothetical protein
MTCAQDDFETDQGGLIPTTIAEIVFNPELRRGREARTKAIANRTATAAASASPETIAPEIIEVATPQKRKRRRAARKSKRRAAPLPESALERHQRKCAICSHEERESIDEEFLNWHSPLRVAIHYELPLRTVFRHAHATGLYLSRQQNLRSVLDRVLERADQANISADGIVRTVRAYTCLTADNRWVEPPSRVIFSSASAPPLVVSAPSRQESLDAAPVALLSWANVNQPEFAAQQTHSNLQDLISSD